MFPAFVPELREDIGWADRFGTLNHFPVARRSPIEERAHDEFGRKLIARISIEIPSANCLRGRRSGICQHPEPEDKERAQDERLNPHDDTLSLFFMASRPAFSPFATLSALSLAQKCMK